MVGHIHHGLRVGGAVGSSGVRANADRYPDVLACPGHCEVLHPGAQVFGHHVRAVRVGAWKQGQKLFATIPANEILPAQPTLQALGNRSQNGVSRQMAILIRQALFVNLARAEVSKPLDGLKLNGIGTLQ